jgi:hypothetical protein
MRGTPPHRRLCWRELKTSVPLSFGQYGRCVKFIALAKSVLVLSVPSVQSLARGGCSMPHAGWRMAPVVFLTMLALAAGNGKFTAHQPVWTGTSAAAAPTGILAPVRLAITSQKFSEPSWTMPDLRGWRLNAAKREILRLTDYNVASLKSHDASGAGREQFWDPNWKVCEQNVPPGARVTTTTTIDFGVVKIKENC